MSSKKFRMIDVMLSVICVVFVAEAAAPAAAIGNQQFFWWILLIFVFLLPYGLVVSELGTTYVGDEGLYGWIRRAFGDKWASRTAWLYWINFTLWDVSLAVLVAQTLQIVLGFEFHPAVRVAIELAFIWITAGFSMSKASESPLVTNVAAVLKVGIGLCVGALGCYHLYHHGFANDMSIATFLPSADVNSLSYLSIILFNFVGFEVVASYSSVMKNPKRQIPLAIVYGGAVIAVIYLFSSFGISVAVPVDEISLDSGIMDAATAMLGPGHILITVIGVVFVLTLFGNIISWSYGVNIVAAYAARNGNMPSYLGKLYDDEWPNNATIANGVLASLFVIALPFAEMFGLGGFFWMFFGCSIVFILVSYLPMFPAFLKLREIEPDYPRPFKVPGNGIVLHLIAWVPVIIMVLGVVATIFPLNGTPEELEKLPMLALGIFVLALGEANVMRRDYRLKREAAKAAKAAKVTVLEGGEA